MGVFRCEIAGEAAAALTHGREAVDCAEKMGNQIARTFAYMSLGLASIMDHAWREALEALERALAIGRERRLLGWEGRVLAAMGAVHLRVGDCAKALALSEEAIAASRRHGTGICDFAALVARVDALRETQGVQARREIEAALAEATAWIEWSGAKSYEPFLYVERAELARLIGDEAGRERALGEAHRLFVEIGATARSEQVAPEIGR